MAISITWATKEIFVPKNDMTLIQSSPTEIRGLDLNFFRLELSALIAAEEGIVFLPTHNHIAPINVGGVTLARVVEIINGYTVTFEDGQYAVELQGANTNLADRVNVNQVSVRSNNSAGLVTSEAIEYGEYDGAVRIHPILGVVGSTYPIGTLRQPSNNVTDAMIIASARGFNSLIFLTDYTLTTGHNVENMILYGVNSILTTITIDPGALTDNCSIKKATITGTLDNNTIVEKSIVNDLLYYNGEMRNCTLQGTVTLGGGAAAHIVDCVAGIPDGDPPIIDLGGTGQSLSVRNYNGELTIRNKSGTDACSINMNAGHLILDSTVTAGDIYIEGTAKVTDNSTGTAIVHMDSVQVAESAYNELVFVDPVLGISGQQYPYGINTRPVPTLVDAFVIAEKYSLNGFSIRGSLVISDDLENITIKGRGVITSNILVMQNVSLQNSYLNRVFVTGSISGSSVFYEDTILNNVSGLSGILVDCVLGGTIYINGITQSRGTILSGNPTILDFSEDASAILQINIDSGNVRIDSLSANNIVQIKLDSGEIIIDDSCTGGLVRISGGASYVDNSEGAVTIIDNTFNTEVTNKIWDEQRDDHNIVGSFGATDEWSGGTSHINPEEIASAVWNANSSDYITSSSFGGKINTISTDATLIKKIEAGRWRVFNNQMIFYEEDGTTELVKFRLYDLAGRPTNTNVMERVPF